ncbi:MAG: SCP2 sterol-binding domain-containing protein [Bdellovibrionota bacterium]
MREFFTERLGRSSDPRFASLKGTFRFDVQGAGSWRLSVDHGELDLQESNEPADCLLQWSDKDLADILSGRRNFLTAFLQGRVRVQGDHALAAGVHNFFKKVA